MSVAFIYALCDPDTGDIRYVGKAKNPKARFKNHCNEHGITRKCRWVTKLHRQGKLPLLDILETVDESRWEQAERDWIAYCRGNGIDLLNLTDGGEGLTGLDDESRKKLSEGMARRMADPEFRAKVLTPERAARISEALTGKPKSPEHVAKLRQNRPGWHHTPEAISKIRKNAAGHRWSEKEIEAVRESNIGNTYGLGNKSRIGMINSAEMNQKISNYQKGRPKTELQRQRMSEARRRWWERKRENGTQVHEGSSSISGYTTSV